MLLNGIAYILAILAIHCTFSINMNANPILYENEIAELKKSIGYDKTSRFTPGGVIMRWCETIKSLPELASWTLRTCQPAVSKQGKSDIEFSFLRGGHRLALSVQWYPGGADVAQNAMFRRAVANTLGFSLYSEGPNLGDVSLIIKREASDSVQNILWCYANIFCRLDIKEGDEDVLPIARQLQNIISKNTFSSVANSQPIIETMEYSNKSPIVGDEIVINVRLARRGNSNAEMFAVVCDTNFIAYKNIDRLAELAFQAVKPGTADIRVFIADPDTLVSTQVIIPIEVLPEATP